MQYFEKERKMNKLTWLVLIFDDVKGAGKGKECNGSAMSCHLENKKREGDFLENAGDT
jgi:hypothetical protein